MDSLSRGAELFNKREFFEAHEIWEDQWREEEGDERHLLQGLIQVAAGLYKLQIGMPSGTFKLMAKAIGHLTAVPEEKLYGVNLPPLLQSAEYWREEARRMVDNFQTRYDVAKLPELEVDSSAVSGPH